MVLQLQLRQPPVSCHSALSASRSPALELSAAATAAATAGTAGVTLSADEVTPAVPAAAAQENTVDAPLMRAASGHCLYYASISSTRTCTLSYKLRGIL
jgi:hypothetical protein